MIGKALMAIPNLVMGLIPDKVKSFFGFGKDKKKPEDPFTGQGETTGGEKFVKEDKEQVPPLVEKIREDTKKQKQELMDATFGSANREEFAKQVAAGVLATQSALSVDESKRAKFTSKDIEALQNAGINMSEIDSLALKNELLKARAAAEGFNPSNNVSTNVVDNSNNSTTVQEEIILDPKITDFNFMTSAAADF